MTSSAPHSEAPRSLARTAARWVGRIVAGLVALVLVVVGAAYALSERRLNARVELPAHASLTPPTDSAAIARGRHIAQVRGCTECHGANLAGRLLVDDPAIGRLAAPNLTRGPGARGAALTPDDWELAVRHGIRRDGRSLLVMPAEDFQGLSDEDMAALVAYARSVAPVAHELPSQRFGPLGRLLFVAGKLPAAAAERVDQRAAHPRAVVAAATPEYGAYVAASCVGCHTQRFTGGPVPGAPPSARPAANITPDPVTGIGRWDEDDFVRALRTARRPDGSMIDSTQMPIAMTRQMSDTELRAVYRYLRTLPAERVAAR